MTLATRFSRLLAFVLCVLVLEAAGGAAVPPADALYNDAMAKERAVRQALSADPAPSTILKAVRTVVEQYELLVRSYPTSGYCDDALWQGGQLSIDAYQRFRESRDRDAALRLHRAIASQYPASKFARQVPAELARVTSIGDPRIETAARVEPAALPPAAATTAPPAAITPAPATSTVSSPNRPATGPAGITNIATIKDIRRAVMADVVRVTIELDAEVRFHEERLSDPARVFIDLTPARATPALVDQTIRFDGDEELVRQIRLGRHPNNTTRVVLEASGVSSFSIYPLYNPYRLVIDSMRAVPESPAPAPAPPPVAPPPNIALSTRPLSVPRAAAAPPALLKNRPLSIPPFKLSVSTMDGAALIAAALAPMAAGAAPAAASTVPVDSHIGAAPTTPTAPGAPQPAVPSANIAGGFSMARQLGLGVSKIVIDPGHGGHDPGAKGNGIDEAELVLDVALRLEALLLKIPGIEVVLTRRTDEFIPLQERTAIANREHADLFLSIHANASTNKQARGVESYFLNLATNPTAEAVAARENATSGQSMGDATKLVNAILLNNKLDESRDLAVMVQRSMLQNLQGLNKTLRDLGVKQAPFVVLIGAQMPSVLSEISFLTNTQDARLLRTSPYRQKIADALFSAIRKYQTSLKSTGAVAGSRP